MWGFPKIRSTLLGVPRIRIIVFWCLYGDPLNLGNYPLNPNTLNPKPCMIWDPSQGVGLEDSRWDWSPGARSSCKSLNSKGTLLGTPNREPQEYIRNIMEYKDPGRYIPIIYQLYSWGSLFGVPRRVPLNSEAWKPRTQ